MIYVSNTYQSEITVVHFQLQHGKKLVYFIAFRQMNRINRKFNMSFFLDTTFSYLGNCYLFQFLFLLKKNCIYKIYFTYSFEFLYFFQHSLLGCSQYCGLKVSFTNLIRKLKNNDIF